MQSYDLTIVKARTMGRRLKEQPSQAKHQMVYHSEEQANGQTHGGILSTTDWPYLDAMLLSMCTGNGRKNCPLVVRNGNCRRSS